MRSLGQQANRSSVRPFPAARVDLMVVDKRVDQCNAGQLPLDRAVALVSFAMVELRRDFVDVAPAHVVSGVVSHT